ncbi:hypothetical protein T265_01576 [Opisthorchis viverrini]|uniref:Uncharacterized protein n=1 Tax=Opisthorchis viverrini TaxID=6198 RepID=A0A074ZZ44_OPIVI|nr:hypothetical protein T265_01576 [Opisthorchis viverrini]KER32351.1 hypothetical protein T265_01576 [Opisthorchis viverrini]
MLYRILDNSYLIEDSIERNDTRWMSKTSELVCLRSHLDYLLSDKLLNTQRQAKSESESTIHAASLQLDAKLSQGLQMSLLTDKPKRYVPVILSL